MTESRVRLSRDAGAAGIITALALAEAAQVYLGLSLQRSGVSWGEALRLTVPSWIVLLALTLPVLWILDRFGSGGLGPVRLLGYLLGAVAFSVLHLAGSALLWGMLGTAQGGFAATFFSLATLYFIPDILTFVAVVTVHALVRRSRVDRRKELDAARLRADDAQARLRTLRGQLRPDFFFNTMNAVTGLVARGNAHDSLEVLSSLSALLRVSLTAEPGRPSRLEDEVELVAAYLSIQGIRFPDRLQGRWVLDPAASGCAVPSLLVVQLVESVVDAGLRAGEPFTVEVGTRRLGSTLEVEVSHTLPGIPLPDREHLNAWVRRFDPAGSLSAQPTAITLLLQARSPGGAGPVHDLEVAS